jgi:hypothetical protein
MKRRPAEYEEDIDPSLNQTHKTQQRVNEPKPALTSKTTNEAKEFFGGKVWRREGEEGNCRGTKSIPLAPNALFRMPPNQR